MNNAFDMFVPAYVSNTFQTQCIDVIYEKPQMYVDKWLYQSQSI